ncbi:MAG TPA: M1 family aminopeptidase, partial [Kofleriaceae bacterium]|nr:M1 family aminopeptidase [Kofleriaceae bacterium]
MVRAWLAVLFAAAASCGPPRHPEPVPPVAVEAADAPAADDGAPVAAPAALDVGVHPTAYRLTLELDPDAPDYRGEVEIDVVLAAPRRVVTVHAAAPLEVTAAAATVSGGAPVFARRLVAGDELVAIELPRALPAGPATLRLEFRAGYRAVDGIFAQTTRGRRYVFSDLEPTDARRAFPCFDEPRFKTPWTVTVRAPDGLRAFGNGPIAAETRQDAWRVTRFATTPPLPSYLVAVAVGAFDVVDVPGAPVPTRLIVPEGRATAVAAAAELLGPILRAAATVVDRPIPFAKVDVAVVPQFGGAMENPGLITIAGELALAPRDDAARRYLAMVLAHEVGHLWFGDQVTLADWREVWLNEGAASWMADATLAAAFPTWATELDRLDDRAAIFVEDALPGAHPIRPRAVGHARELFDALTYERGAAIWHGLEGWLGPARFRAGLGGYLDAHAWGSVTTDDLARALAAAAPGAPVAAVIAAAVERAGPPHVHADVVCRPGRAELRLRTDGAPRPTAVCARWGGAAGPGQAGESARACTVVDGAGALDLGATCPAWVHPNAGAAGYYQWQLPRPWWGRLAAAPLDGSELRDALDAVVPALATGAIDLATARPLLAASVRAGQRRLTAPAIDVYRLLLRTAGAGDAHALRTDLDLATRALLADLGWSPRPDEPPGTDEVRAAALRGAGELVGDRRTIAWARKQVLDWH